MFDDELLELALELIIIGAVLAIVVLAVEAWENRRRRLEAKEQERLQRSWSRFRGGE